MRVNIDKVDSAKLHALLMAVDRDTAITMHPNTARKIVRALEVCSLKLCGMVRWHAPLKQLAPVEWILFDVVI